MATRTRTQWETEYATPAGAAGFLSAAAEWLGLRDLTITIVLLWQETLLYYMTAIQNYVDTKDPGTIYWYPDMVKAFQYGDSLTDTDGLIGYNPVTPANRIVTQCSVREQPNGSLDIKVAKTVSGSLAPLTNTELLALTDYISKRRSPGVAINVISRNADVVKTTIAVRYDGLYAKATIDAAVDAARTAFRDNLRFDAVFYKAQLIEDIMAVDGVVSVTLRVDMTLSDGTTVTDLVEMQELPAGYFNYDAASTYTSTPA